MRLFIALLLSMVSLHAESMGVNATKLPPTRKQSTVRHAPPGKAGAPTMKMPTSKHSATKGNSNTPGQKGGAIARAVSGKASKTRAKASVPPPKK
jgi:hypothetical protein